MSLLLGAFLVGIAAGLYIGLILAQLLHEPPDEHETIVLIASRPVNDDRPGQAVIDSFTAARLAKHSIISRLRDN